MGMELAAGRLLSRVMGQSLYTWTSIIGVVMAGLSLGNSLGGRLADRWPAPVILAWSLFLASLSCFVVPPLHQAIAGWVWLWDFSGPVRVLVHAAAVFFAPALLMGLIPPVAARVALGEGGTPGRTLGRLYAWNAGGSIAGTFLAGFFLVAAVGALGTVLLAGAGLGFLLLSTGGRAKGWALAAALLLWIGLAPGSLATRLGRALRLRDNPAANVVYHDESQYSYIAVKTTDRPGVRGLYLDKMMHSEMDIHDPSKLLYKYAWIYEAALDHFSPAPAPVSAFVIGGGGYTFPRYLALTRPGSRVDVAEIDPAVTRAAQAACGLEPDANIHIHHLDARNFVEDLVRRKDGVGRVRRTRRDFGALGQRALPDVPPYDYIFGDTFNDYSVPYHLTTVEFTRALAGLMSDRGLYMLNMIDRFDSGRFLAAVVATFREAFPGVYVFFCHRNLTSRGTYVVIGSKRALEASDLAAMTERLRKRPDFFGFLLTAEQVDGLLARTRARPLTDDYAPVENLLADVVRRDRPEGLDFEHIRNGLREAEQGRLDEAVREFERALELNPSNVKALYNLGVARMNQGELRKALQVFGAALEAEPENADVRNNAGVSLARLGMYDQAAEQFEAIVRLQPESVDARVNLAAIRAQQGRGDEARALLQEALRLNPDHVQARQNLQALGSR